MSLTAAHGTCPRIFYFFPNSSPASLPYGINYYLLWSFIFRRRTLTDVRRRFVFVCKAKLLSWPQEAGGRRRQHLEALVYAPPQSANNLPPRIHGSFSQLSPSQRVSVFPELSRCVEVEGICTAFRAVPGCNLFLLIGVEKLLRCHPSSHPATAQQHTDSDSDQPSTSSSLSHPQFVFPEIRLRLRRRAPQRPCGRTPHRRTRSLRSVSQAPRRLPPPTG